MAFHNKCIDYSSFELALPENIVSLKPTIVEPVLPCTKAFVQDRR